MMSYQEIKYKRLIYILTITDMEVLLSMLKSYLEVRRQMFWKSQKSIIYLMLDLLYLLNSLLSLVNIIY